MSAILATIRRDYVNNFPRDVPETAAKSFVITGAINLAAGSSINQTLFGGALAITATLIEALTRPIIMAIFPQNATLAKFVQIVVPLALTFGLAVAAGPLIGVSCKISSLILPLIVSIVLNNSLFA